MRAHQVVIVSLLLIAGCSAGSSGPHPSAPSPSRNSNSVSSSTAAAKNAEFPEGALTTSAAPPPGPRRVIYQGKLELVVPDFEAYETARTRMTELLAEAGGYVAESKIERTTGELQSAHWKIRIPSERFMDFVDALESLGYPRHRESNTQEVTEEFVDLEARLATKRRLEQRAVQIAESKVGSIRELFEVEKDLAQVRGEVERMDGRLRYLTNVTELATLDLTVRVERVFPPPAELPFLARLDSAFSGSLGALTTFGQRLAIILAVLAPWLVAFAPAAAVAFLLLRRRNPFSRGHTPAAVR